MLQSLKNRTLALLRWSETYTKTDMLYAVHGGFWLVVAKMVALGSSLLLAVAMANFILPQTFGVYKFVLSATGILGAITLTGAGAAIVQSVARGYEGAFRSGTIEYIKWSLGSVALAISMAIYYLVNENYTLAASFFIVAICNPILVSSSFFTQFISAKKDFRTGSIFDSIADIVPVSILIAATLLTQNPVFLIATYFLSGTGINLVLRHATIRKYRPNDRVDPETIPYARHLSLIGMIGKIAENVDKILVFHYLGAAQLAIYAFAQTPIAQLKLFNDIPARLALPKLSARNLSELKDSLPRKILLLVGVMTVVVIIYIALAPFLFRLLFPQYLESIVLTQVLALSLIFAPGSMFGEALTAHMRKKELYISQTILPIAKIGLFMLLLPAWGIWGAVCTTIVSQCLMFIIYSYLFLRTQR